MIEYHCEDCDFETDDAAAAESHTRLTDHSVEDVEVPEPTD